MTEDTSKCAPSASSCTTSQATKDTVPMKEEGEVVVDSMTASNKSSCSADKSSPRYAIFIVKHPYVLLVLISVLVILSGCFSLIPQLGAQPLPEFIDPFKGFQARGTVISDRWRSQMSLIYDELGGEVTRVPAKCGIKNPISEQLLGVAPAICSKEQTFYQGKITAKLMFGTKDGQDLLTAKNLKSICRLEEKIVRKYHGFDDYCHKANGTQHCCPSWSVGYYIALLNGDTSCLSIDETKLKKASSLLKMCSTYYHKGTLKPDCWDFMKNRKVLQRCNQVPDACTTFNAVYNVLHYLTDKHFLSGGSDPSLFLRYSLVLVPIKENEHFQVDIYKSRLKDNDISDGNVVLSGYELSKLKFAIFNEQLLIDLYLAAVAMFFIMIILLLYTRSFLLTSLIGLIVASSVVIAYFMYTRVFAVKFFPFLNAFTAVFLVGIAADDAFIYMDIWNQSKREHRAKLGQPPSNQKERDEELICVTVDTMKHASLSMFLTSFTTSSAFLACLTSEITSIQLFGLFSGVSVLCMFFLMVTWFPAAVMIEQTAFSRFNCCSTFCGKLQQSVFKGTCRIRRVVDKLKAWYRAFCMYWLPSIVVKLRYFSVAFFLLVAAGSIVVSTVKPGLQLPSSPNFQTFRKWHELEKNPLKLRKNFHFESTKKSSFPVNLIWGIEATDTGDKFDPYDMGSLKWDDDFDIASREGQQWIASLIPRLKKQPFLAKDQKLGFVEEFFAYMRLNCTKNNKICCTDSTFPYNSTIFSECMQEFQCQRIKKIHFSSQGITDDAPFFDANGRLRAISLKFDSTVAFTWSYHPADNFWTETESWSHEEFNKAPSSAKGWFISKLQFYDLQKSLSKGTLTSISISLAIAFGVMLLTTGNVYISVIATVTIICVLSVTVGSLVLLGWKLNILESVTLSVCVGLSVDFTLHYGVAYVLAKDKTDRNSRVFFSVTCMSSAITMAAFTTFVAGAIATQATVICYFHTGQFLMIIMSVSWVYATFFFQGLCSILGPENSSGQMSVSKLKEGYRRLKARLCCKKEGGAEVSKPVRVFYQQNKIEIE